MCHRKPGPRCSRHVKDAIARLETQRDADMAAFMNGHSEHRPRNIAADLARLHDEYDETSTGQAELRAKIAELEASQEPFQADDPWGNGDPFARGTKQARISDLQNRLHDAVERRAAKLAALKSSEEGNVRAAQMQLKYGAHAGWLHATTLPEEVDTRHGGQISVQPGYAVATTFLDEHNESDDRYGESWAVKDIDVAWETPARPGPRPGTWITGDPKRGLRDGAPYLYDENTRTLTEYDPDRVDTPATVDLNNLTDLSGLDFYDNVNGHTDYRDADEVEISEVQTSLRGHGDTRTLRVETHLSAVWQTTGQRRQFA